VSGPFGHDWKAEWAIDPEVTYLNHGTVGAPPRRVLAEQQRIRDEIERQPSRFLLRELAEVRFGSSQRERPRLREAADEVGRFLGAEGDEIVFVDNATTGIDAVLASLPLGPDDEILVTDHAYGAVAIAARAYAERAGAGVRTARLPFPPGSAVEVVESIAGSVGERTRLVVVEHVTSATALVLPLAEILERCRTLGVATLVDGAHAPGMLPLDLAALDADWYVGNLHKWAWTPRPLGFVRSAPRRRNAVRSPVVSWGSGRGSTVEFDWPGTRDPTPALAAPAALEMLREVGLAAVRRWNHELVLGAARSLARRWGASFDLDPGWVGSMALVPLPERFAPTDETAGRLRDELLDEERIEVQIGARDGRLWARIAAQIYNQASDFERLGEAIDRR